jgi:hypothetical protein
MVSEALNQEQASRPDRDTSHIRDMSPINEGALMVDFNNLELSYPQVSESVLRIGNITELNDSITPKWSDKIKISSNTLDIDFKGKAFFNAQIPIEGPLEIELLNHLLKRYTYPKTLRDLSNVDGLFSDAGRSNNDFEQSNWDKKIAKTQLILRQRRTQGITYFNENSGLVFLLPLLINDHRPQLKNKKLLKEST